MRELWTSEGSKLVDDLQARFIDRLEQVVEQVCQAPGWSATIDKGTVGSSTSYQGFILVVSCVHREAALDDPDQIALSIILRYLDGIPQVMADVTWGHPSGHVEVEFPRQLGNDDWPVATPGVLDDLSDDLPALIGVLHQAIGRGLPPQDPLASA